MKVILSIETILFIQTQVSFYLFHLKNTAEAAAMKAQIYPVSCHTKTLHWSVLSNTQPSDHSYISCLKFTNTDTTCKSGTGKNSVPVGCQMKSFTSLLSSERSPDYNTTLTELTE